MRADIGERSLRFKVKSAKLEGQKKTRLTTESRRHEERKRRRMRYAPLSGGTLNWVQKVLRGEQRLICWALCCWGPRQVRSRRYNRLHNRMRRSRLPCRLSRKQWRRRGFHRPGLRGWISTGRRGLRYLRTIMDSWRATARRMWSFGGRVR